MRPLPPRPRQYKIYILDEAHQITDAAFNALLKTLEEPPDHIVFMMATTQPEDIPQTVRSRCQHFSFHAVSWTIFLGSYATSPGRKESRRDAALASGGSRRRLHARCALHHGPGDCQRTEVGWQGHGSTPRNSGADGDGAECGV